MTLTLFFLTALIACGLSGHTVVKDFPWLYTLLPKNRVLRGLVKCFLGGLLLIIIMASFVLIEYLPHLLEQ